MADEVNIKDGDSTNVAKDKIEILEDAQNSVEVGMEKSDPSESSENMASLEEKGNTTLGKEDTAGKTEESLESKIIVEKDEKMSITEVMKETESMGDDKEPPDVQNDNVVSDTEDEQPSSNEVNIVASVCEDYIPSSLATERNEPHNKNDITSESMASLEEKGNTTLGEEDTADKTEESLESKIIVEKDEKMSFTKIMKETESMGDDKELPDVQNDNVVSNTEDEQPSSNEPPNTNNTTNPAPDNNPNEPEIDPEPFNAELAADENDLAAAAEDDLAPHIERHRQRLLHRQNTKKSFVLLHYTPLSLFLAGALLWYAFRSRQGQFYPAVLFLSSSKLSYIIFGNAIVALSVSTFYILVNVFLNGLRLAEREAIGESVRWSMTETCLALTMFREEVSVNMVGLFLTLTVSKCLHWAVDFRGKHLIQTEEAISVSLAPEWKLRLPPSHIKYVFLTQVLLLMDVAALGYCVKQCLEEGPSVHLLFGFESVVLALTASNALAMYWLHACDGLVTVMVTIASGMEPGEGSVAPVQGGGVMSAMVDRIAGLWRDKRFTLTLSVDLFTHAGKFLSYLLFFFLVFTYYGMPINIFRDLYISFQEFKRKILQFISYRRLSRLMQTKFHTVSTEEELDACGRDCIICRDDLNVTDKAKKLPGCGHVFHPYCLKGWLMQQQTCPTCRRDIMKACREIPETTPTPPTPTETETTPVEPTESVDTNTIKDADPEANATSEQASREITETTAESNPVATQTEPKGIQKPDLKSETQSKSVTHTKPSLSESLLVKEKAAAFPCFYKISNPDGANVYHTERTIMRSVPFEKYILCTEMMWWRPLNIGDGSDEDTQGRMMLKMPDGWVKEKDVTRVSLPISMEALIKT